MAVVGVSVAVVGVAGWLEDPFFSLFLRLGMATIVIENSQPEKICDVRFLQILRPFMLESTNNYP